MKDLEAARRRYNELQPDRPIKRVGDALEASYYLTAMRVVWEHGGKPLSDQEIASVEMMTPPGCFS
ncbi:hypothetical protein [Ensifer sp. B1-9]|uniref:hypothetical protein n=1 Tax=Ensifer sp. B1-9 TaxID=3141455 RepID=UPI003D2191A8